VVGCRRGAFPAAPRADPLLRDGERLAVNRASGRLALRTRAAHRAEALYVAFCALAAGRQALALTWAVPGPDGTGGPAAPLVYDLLSSAGHELSEVASPEPDLAGARTSREALAAAARLGRGGEGEDALAALRSASAELSVRAASALARGDLERARLEAVLARRADPASGALPTELLAAWRQTLPEEWTPSQLESHARCPYQLFAGLGLRLAEPEVAELDIDPRDEGSLVHAVLERFLRDRLAHAALPLRDTPDERDRLSRFAEELFACFASDGRAGDPALWAGRRAAVRARLGRVLSAEAAASGDAVPVLLEYRFGGDSGVPPLVLGMGAGEVRLRGRLDRVDASADRLVLIDYKNSGSPSWKKKLAPEALGETNFQLPAYLLAAARALPGRSRLEATYLLLRSAQRLPPWITGPEDPLLASGPGALDGGGVAEVGSRSFAEAAAAAVASIRRGELPVASRDCKGCGFGAVCRAERLAEDAP
jgi:ATP-dependent helicase/nuclease subunit B